MSEVINVNNPWNNESAGCAPLLGEKELKDVVERAKAARAAWRNTSVYKRSQLIEAFLCLVDEHAEELAWILTCEMGKPITQARAEIGSIQVISESFVQRANHLYGEVLNADNQPGYEEDLIFTRREPLGIIACIIPFNYPVKLMIHKVIPALVMGNVVLAKAPRENPLTILKLGELFIEAGFPEGVISCFICGREDSTKYLIENADIQAVSLTGSTKVGIQMVEASAKTMKHMFMELGGNDGTIVRADADADLDSAVEDIVRGRMVNAGQTCCACKRILVDNRIREEFTEKLLVRIAAVKTGDPLDTRTELGTVISERAAMEVERQIALTVAQGAKVAAGGVRRGAVIEPTVLTDVTKDMDIARDMEVFGPVIPVIGFDTDEEALQIINQPCYGLSSGIITKDLKIALRMAAKIEAGAVVLNGQGNYRHTEQGFGGVKMTGFSREGVSATLEEFSQVKHFIVRKVFIA